MRRSKFVLAIILISLMVVIVMMSGAWSSASEDPAKKAKSPAITRPPESKPAKPMRGKNSTEVAIITIIALNGRDASTVYYKDGAYFDHDANGFAEQTGWVNANAAGILAWDRNKNGKIDNGTELLGNFMVIKGKSGQGGILLLNHFDKNRDGKIDEKDEIFSDLVVWQDYDGDGYSSSDELLTLKELGVKALHLRPVDVNREEENGNTLLREATYEKDDGTTGKIADYRVLRDTTYTISTDWLNVPADISSLPDLQAYGNLHDLHQAMARERNGKLVQLVRMAQAENDPGVRTEIFEQLLFRWAGADHVLPDSRGSYIDARRLALLEKTMGSEFRGINIMSGNPNEIAAGVLLQAYEGMFESFYGQLMSQTHLRELYSLISYTFDDQKQTLKGNLKKSIEKLKTLLQENEEQGKTLLKEFARTIKGLQAKDTISYADLEAAFPQYRNLPCLGAEKKKTGSVGSWNIIIASAYNTVLFGGKVDDNLSGWICNDRLYGQDGKDHLYGGSGDDYLDGGQGDDYLDGGTGNDTYVFGKGYGYDFIIDKHGQNTVVFTKDVKPSNLKFVMKSGVDLYITLKTTLDAMRIQDWKIKNDYTVKKFVFADGQTWTPEDIEKRISTVEGAYYRVSEVLSYTIRYLLTYRIYLYIILSMVALLVIEIGVKIILRKRGKSRSVH